MDNAGIHASRTPLSDATLELSQGQCDVYARIHVLRRLVQLVKRTEDQCAGSPPGGNPAAVARSGFPPTWLWVFGNPEWLGSSEPPLQSIRPNYA